MGSDARPTTAELSGVLLQRAGAADVPEISALEQACYGDPWPVSAFSSLPDNSRVFFVLARSGPLGSIAGYAVAWYVMDEGELANLAVAPLLRGQGIGRALLDAMLADAKKRGIANVYLEVRESNVPARQLYSARGFAEVGRRKGYYRSPTEDALILRSTLEPELR